MSPVKGLRTLCVVQVLMFFPSMVMAAEPAVSATVASPLASILQMFLGLGIVLVAIAGMAWLLRRMAPGQVGTASGLRVVAAVAVGPKERVVLVDVGGQRLVLGVTPGQVSKLMEMPQPEVTEILPTAVPPFVAKLKEILAKQRGKQ